MVLARLKNSLEREVYAGKLAEETGVSKAAILDQVGGIIKKEVRTAKKREWNEVQSGRALYQDRINPQKASHLKAAMAEEQILVYLLRNPDGLKTALNFLTSEDFVTDFNRRVFTIIIQKGQETGEVDLSVLASELKPEEMGKISGLLAKSREMDNTRQQLLDSIQVLKDNRERLKPADLKDGGTEELKRFYEQQKQKKNRR